MNKSSTQNPYGISTVRISRAELRNLGELDAVRAKSEIIQSLKVAGFGIRQGTPSDKIQLAGERGVQTHIKASDAYVFFGRPTLVELFKLASLFVGLQTLDTDLHMQKGEQKLRRPVIVYGDPEHFMPLFNLAMHMHKNMGTVRQNPHSIIRFAQTPDELQAQLRAEVVALDSVHGHGASKAEIAAATAHYTQNTFFDYQFSVPKPNFSVVAYTSAGKHSDDAFKLGAEFGRNGIGCVSGAGKTGSMGDFARGAHSVGGWASGVNCAHIAAQEGLPEGMIVRIKPDIYSRMHDMKSQGNAIIVGTGGYGGMGTVQEMLAACFLLIERNQLMVNGRGSHSSNKPIIFDNSKGLWQGVEKVLEPYGIFAGRHYVVADSCDKVLEYAIQARDRKLDLRSSNEVRPWFGPFGKSAVNFR